MIRWFAKLFHTKSPFVAREFFIAILLSLAVGFFSSLLTGDAVRTWYPTLISPPLTPPSWVFGPVWTVLYILMGVAAYGVWRLRFAYDDARKGLVLFGLQLGLNGAWSLAFFGLQSPLFALVDIVLLNILLVVTIKIFFSVYRLSGWLLIPYLLWVLFATYLNIGFVLLN